MFGLQSAKHRRVVVACLISLTISHCRVVPYAAVFCFSSGRRKIVVTKIDSKRDD
jgi:hypothetical protein